MISTHTSLLLRLRSREDSAAWNRFVEIYTPLIFHWVVKLGIDRNRAEDIVQDIFLVLLGKISFLTDQPPRSFRAWLQTVTLNKCRDWFRAQQRATNPVLLERIEQAIEDPQELLTEAEYRSFVAHAALRLMKQSFGETTWRACWAQVVEGKPAAVIARELGISENAVYLARGRVLSRLRAELQGLWDDQ